MTSLTEMQCSWMVRGSKVGIRGGRTELGPCPIPVGLLARFCPLLYAFGQMA